MKKVWAFILRAWELFNGKKTVIGGVFCFLSVFITEVVIGIWGADASWLPPLVRTLNWIGMPLMGIGGVHKGVKLEMEIKSKQSQKA